MKRKLLNAHLIHLNVEGRYMCNRAVEPFEEKLTTDEEKITCHNCKVQIRMNKQRKEKENLSYQEIKEKRRNKHMKNIGPRIENLDEKLNRIREKLRNS